jgi:hypothetical protein
MRKVVATIVSVTLFSLPAMAAMNILVGTFGHTNTTEKHDLVWTITESKGLFNLRFHGDSSVRRLKMLSLAKRQKFWQKMWWESNSYIKAICLGDDIGTIVCSVSKNERAAQPDLKHLKSDTFYYDPVFGLIEMIRI